MVRAVCLVAFAVIGLINVQAQEYAITDVGTLGGRNSEALGLNDLGQVVGWSHDLYGVRSPYIWNDGRIQQLNRLGHNVDFRAIAINNHGQSCGYYGGNSYNYNSALTWHDLVLTILEPFPGNRGSRALDINDAGDIVGGAITITGKQRAALWTTDGIRDLSLPLDPLSSRKREATAINNVGQIVVVVEGYCTYCETTYLWQDGEAVKLFEYAAYGKDINDHGTIVGYWPTGRMILHAFIWDHGVDYDIGKLPGDSDACAFAVNENNIVVGTSYSPTWGDRAFVWDGVMADLNDRIPEDSDWFLQEAFDINVHGQIVGYGLKPDGETRGYLLTPLFSQPEVSMLSLFVGCLSGPYPDSPAECELFDFNDSGTIDLEDFAYFQRRYRD